MSGRFVLQNLKKLDGEKIDIVIDNGVIVDISAAGHGRGDRALDYSGVYVSSGWIDLHVHAFPEFDPYGDDIDEIGVKQGVTTVVDAGSTGADRIGELVKIGAAAKTNLLTFLNISRIGLERVDELSHLAWIDREKVLRAVDQYKETIVGLKARISQSVVKGSGLEPLRIARRLSEETGRPLMVHIGSAPPDIRDILPLLEKGDALTHYLNGKTNNLFGDNGRPLSEFMDAIQRGIHLDVGHGNASFSFKVAEAAKKHNIGLNTISSDIYRKNRLHGPVYSLANVLTKFLYLGYSLEEVIAAVTINAAEWLRRPALGRIKTGDRANLTLFNIEKGPVTLVDSEGAERIANKKIVAKAVVANGQFYTC